MSSIIKMLATEPMVVYLLGMTFVVILACIFCLSVRYYIKAKDLVPYMRKIKELADKVIELQNKVEDAEKQLKDKMAEIIEADKHILEGKQWEKWIEDHKKEIEETNKVVVKVREEMESCKVQKADLERQISERQQQLIEVNEKIKNAENRVKAAEKEIEASRKEKAALVTQIPALQAKRDEIQRDIIARKNKFADLEKEIKVKNDELSELRKSHEQVVGAIAAKKSELAACKEQIEKLDKQIDVKAQKFAELQGEANVAQQSISEWKAQREETGEKWKNLDAPIVKEELMQHRGVAKIDEQQWLEGFCGRLKANGFIFDDRAIRAFHTGLKCAQQTPLVVLAGISGTGKSLLPELYASALGMNFLSVPVQPRWDSPQDLFGFYNYMEGRYKATELARLLWQFDRYNNPVARKKYDIKTLPLNLVLLDEMNLARVEYYFSDLLSKLETRNGLNAENELERQKAEIELECNAADKLNSMRHLFVSPYTLFVGTMNEDESTQTLSDKVIDRSNVLRFGRPRTLVEAHDEKVREPDKSGFIESYADASRISAHLWNGWCKNLEEATRESDALSFLHSTVTPVVEALDKVYRSYGFRVDKAMKLYVMNYPGSYKEAVADQIEMKILPKLNGIELQDQHFEEVKSAMLTAIDATDDEKLREAFEAACPEDGTFFKWRGVMR